MDKKKVIYIGIIMIMIVIVSITYFSYAFFTHKDEQHGKLNIVAGTLNYKIESDDLNNNSLIIKGNTTTKINLSIKSLNEISTWYELSYDTGSDNIEVGYLTNNTKGEIGVNDEEIVTLLITNPTSTEEKLHLELKEALLIIL